MDVTFCFRSESRRTTLPAGSTVSTIQRAFLSTFSDKLTAASPGQLAFRVAKDLVFFPLTPESISKDMIIDVSYSESNPVKAHNSEWITNVKGNLPSLFLGASPIMGPLPDRSQSNDSGSFGNHSTPTLSPLRNPLLSRQGSAPSAINFKMGGYQQHQNAEQHSTRYVYPTPSIPSPCLLPAAAACSPFRAPLNSSPFFVSNGFSLSQPHLFPPTLISASSPVPSSPLLSAVATLQSAVVGNSFRRSNARHDPDSRFVLRLRGLPWTARHSEIENFFCDERIVDIQIIFLSDGRSSGEALVEFETHEDLCLAKTKHRQHMGHRYIEIFPSNSYAMEAVRNQNRRRTAEQRANLRVQQKHVRSATFEQSSLWNESLPDGTEELSRTMHVLSLGRETSNGDSTESQEQKDESITPTSEGGQMESEEKALSATYVLRLRGLPYSATRADILQFFAPIVPCSVHVMKDNAGRSSGEGYVELASQVDACEALKKDRQHMGHRYIEIFQSSTNELARALGLPHEGALKILAGSSNTDSTCILVRGLPYASTETDIAKFFAETGTTPSKIHRKADGGEAYVEFRSAADADKGMQRNKHYIGHRYVELFRVSYNDMAKTVGLPREPNYQFPLPPNSASSSPTWTNPTIPGFGVPDHKMERGTYLQLSNKFKVQPLVES